MEIGRNESSGLKSFQFQYDLYVFRYLQKGKYPCMRNIKQLELCNASDQNIQGRLTDVFEFSSKWNAHYMYIVVPFAEGIITDGFQQYSLFTSLPGI